MPLRVLQHNYKPITEYLQHFHDEGNISCMLKKGVCFEKITNVLLPCKSVPKHMFECNMLKTISGQKHNLLNA